MGVPFAILVATVGASFCEFFFFLFYTLLKFSFFSKKNWFLDPKRKEREREDKEKKWMLELELEVWGNIWQSFPAEFYKCLEWHHQCKLKRNIHLPYPKKKNDARSVGKSAN